MSNTIHALKASAKKNWLNSETTPRTSTNWNNRTPKASVVRNEATFRAAIVRCDRSIRHVSPARPGTSRMNVSILKLSLQLSELARIHRIEAFPDTIDENPEDHHGDHHVEKDAQFDHQRHAVGGQRH